MFRVLFGNKELHHPDSEYVATHAKLIEELNTHGSLDMTLNDLRDLQLRSIINVYDDDGLCWRGRVLSIEKTLNSRNNVHFEGALAFLCDTILPPFAFRGSPLSLFSAIIQNHNDQLSANDPRRFVIGSITVTDPNDYINRSSESAMTSWEAITSRLIDTLGGYVYLSGESLNVINYVADFSAHSGQAARFSENLIDITDTANADGVVTALIPYGAQYEESDPNHEAMPTPAPVGFVVWGGNRLHLTSQAENPASVRLQAAVDKYGLVYGTETWDDITIAANLEAAATRWLQQNLLEHIGALEVNAADESLIDASVDKIGVGTYVDVICEPMHIDGLTLLCQRKETDLIDVSNTTISLGKAPITLTGKAVIK